MSTSTDPHNTTAERMRAASVMSPILSIDVSLLATSTGSSARTGAIVVVVVTPGTVVGDVGVVVVSGIGFSQTCKHL